MPFTQKEPLFSDDIDRKWHSFGTVFFRRWEMICGIIKSYNLLSYVRLGGDGVNILVFTGSGIDAPSDPKISPLNNSDVIS